MYPTSGEIEIELPPESTKLKSESDFWRHFRVSCVMQSGRQSRLFSPGGGTFWMGSYFHEWIDYNGVAFSRELLEWGRTFSDVLGKTVLHIYG